VELFDISSESIILTSLEDLSEKELIRSAVISITSSEAKIVPQIKKGNKVILGLSLAHMSKDIVSSAG
jgi:hypothetical protein